MATTPADVTELVEQTLDWVTHGDPNSTDLIAVTTSEYPIAAQDLGFRGNDERIVSLTEFIREDESSCTVEIAMLVDGTTTLPDNLTLAFGQDDRRTYPSHREGLIAFYTWCGGGQVS